MGGVDGEEDEDDVRDRFNERRRRRRLERLLRRGGNDGEETTVRFTFCCMGFCPSEREKGTILLALLFTKQSDGNTSKNKPRLYPATFYKTNRNIFNSSNYYLVCN
jgi:hypothetical protein